MGLSAEPRPPASPGSASLGSASLGSGETAGTSEAYMVGHREKHQCLQASGSRTALPKERKSVLHAPQAREACGTLWEALTRLGVNSVLSNRRHFSPLSGALVADAPARADCSLSEIVRRPPRASGSGVLELPVRPGET